MNSEAVSQAWGFLPDYLGQHVLLSLSAILLGIAISLPLAIAAQRSRFLRGPALGFASIVQTIPGLALLALFYPVLLFVSAFTQRTFGFGLPALGFLPALLALTLYSMLPVLRNTIVGLESVDPAAKTAALGVGMTPWQSLTMVELPLAAPVIMAGIRTASVWVIGTATLSTPVGQTSLGNYIFTGLQTENWVLVLFGCVAAGLLALVIDRLLALVETSFVDRSRPKFVAAIVGLLLVIAASVVPVTGGPDKPVVIGNKGFDEQYTLSEMISHRLKGAGFETVRRDGLGSSVIFTALAAGDVDVYVDYSGTVWTTDMKRGDAPGRAAVLAEMARWLKDKHGIGYIGAIGFENAYAFAMRSDRARALNVKSLADIAAHAPELKIGGDYEIFLRPEWRAVVKAYGLKFAVQRTYQANFMYKALMDGDVDVISAFSSDGRIAQYKLALLDDPKHALPPYDAVLLVSPKRAGDARFVAALKPMIGAIDLVTMQQANLMVDRVEDKKTPEQAAQWIEDRIK